MDATATTATTAENAPAVLKTPKTPLYGAAWLREEAVRKLALLRQPMYAFAQIVAGKVNMRLDALLMPIERGLANYVESRGSTLDDFILEHTKKASNDGVKDKISSVVDVEPTRSSSAPASRTASTSEPSSMPSTPINAETTTATETRAYTTAEQDRETQQLATLALALIRSGVLTSDVAEGWRFLERRSRSRTLAELAWQQLPQHLGLIFYSDSLMSAFQSAYANVLARRQDLTFYDLISPADPRLRDIFASLVATHIKIARYDMPTYREAPTRYVGVHARERYVKEQASLLRTLNTLPLGGPTLSAASYAGAGAGAGSYAGAIGWAPSPADWWHTDATSPVDMPLLQPPSKRRLIAADVPRTRHATIFSQLYD